MTIIEEYSAEIIKLILSMTVTGSIVSFFLFILKPIIKDKLSKSFQYYMWFLVVVALMLPVSKINVLPEKPISFVFTPQEENEKNAKKNTFFPSNAVALFVSWQLGMILFLGFKIICYVSYARRLNKHNMSTEPQEIELLNNLLERKSSLRLYKNPIVETPILIGFFRPVVILPNKKYEDMKLQNILMHEITHKKRHDIFIKWLLIIVGAVHWFNPLVYFVRREMDKACEMACDEAVIKRLDISGKQQYGDTLISVAADTIRKKQLSISMFEDKKILKERLDAIMKHKKHSKRIILVESIILSATVCIILGVGTLYGPEVGHSYVDNFSSLQDQKHIKEIELRDILCNYDKKNIDEAHVFLSDSDGEITNAYINIICQEKNPNSEMQNGIKSLAAEKLGLDIQNIHVDYMDFKSYTSNERESK